MYVLQPLKVSLRPFHLLRKITTYLDLPVPEGLFTSEEIGRGFSNYGKVDGS